MTESQPELVRTPEVELCGEAGRLIIRRLNHVPLSRYLVEGPIPNEHMPKVLQELAKLTHLSLDDRPTSIGKALPGVCVRVRDIDRGVLARLEQDPNVTEVFVNGALRCGQILHPIGDHGLHEKAFNTLRRGRKLRQEEYERFVQKVLPGLRQALPVYIESTLLQGSVQLRPYLRIFSKEIGEQLQIYAELVYGNPPVARVARGQMVLDEESAMPARDLRHEALLQEHLQDQFGIAPGEDITVSGHNAHQLARRLCQASEPEIVVVGSAHHLFARQAHLTPDMDWSENGPELWFQGKAMQDPLHPDGQAAPEEQGQDEPGPGFRVDARKALDAWYKGERFLFSPEEGLLELPAEWLEKHADRLAAVLAQRPGKDRPLAPHLVDDLKALSSALDRPATGVWRERLTQAIDKVQQQDAQLPPDLQAELRQYQVEGVAWLQSLRDAGLGALLADDMGLGKTLQSLCAINGRTLIVSPTSVLFGWAQEIKKFRPSLSFITYHGPNRKLDREVDVVLTTYTILRLDRNILSQEHWNMVILDEAQTIKNASSQVAQSVFELQSNFRLALTGTPIENRLEDLWSQFHFLNRGLLGGRRDFLRRYSTLERDTQDERMGRLRQRIAPFILRRKKSEVLAELPPRTEVELHVELNEAERSVYDTVYAATREDLVARVKANASVLEVLEALLRLRQAACHPALVPGHEDLQSKSSAKTRELIGILQEITAEGHKALVFSQWTSFMDLIGQQFKEAGLSYLRLDGSTRNRGDIVQRFQEQDEEPILLASLRAGGTGLNLTAADHVFLMDPWWNPAVEAQAADRAHRMGQQNPVVIHRLISNQTIEQKVLALQQHKKQLAASALDSGSTKSGLSKDELLALLDIS